MLCSSSILGSTRSEEGFLLHSRITPLSLREESGVLNAVLPTFPTFLGRLHCSADLRPLWTTQERIGNLEMLNFSVSYYDALLVLKQRRKSRIWSKLSKFTPTIFRTTETTFFLNAGFVARQHCPLQIDDEISPRSVSNLTAQKSRDLLPFYCSQKIKKLKNRYNTTRPIRSCIEVLWMFWAFSRPADGPVQQFTYCLSQFWRCSQLQNILPKNLNARSDVARCKYVECGRTYHFPFRVLVS